MATKKAVKKTSVKKAPSKKTTPGLKKGSKLACEVCGMVVAVDTLCGCVETCDLLCCDKPMKLKK